MRQVNPYINFNGDCEEAFLFYKSVFGGELRLVRFKDMKEELPGAEKLSAEKMNKIANIALAIGADTTLMGDDGPAVFGNKIKECNKVSIEIEAESEEEATRLFHALAEGGEVKMKLAKTSWAQKFGHCVDKYGMRWMVNYSGE